MQRRAALGALPLIRAAELKGGHEESCCICLEDILSKTKLRVLPCMHYFHPECIAEWAQGSPACPMCKRMFTEE